MGKPPATVEDLLYFQYSPLAHADEENLSFARAQVTPARDTAAALVNPAPVVAKPLDALPDEHGDAVRCPDDGAERLPVGRKDCSRGAAIRICGTATLPTPPLPPPMAHSDTRRVGGI